MESGLDHRQRLDSQGRALLPVMDQHHRALGDVALGFLGARNMSPANRFVPQVQ
jgi:sensor histidine kinase regulating citrate/malate metabolism